MTPLRRYGRVLEIQIGEVDGKVKAEGIGVISDAEHDDTASTAELTGLDSDEEGANSSDDEDEAHDK